MEVCAVLHFWLEVLLRAFLDTLAGIGKEPAELRFSVFVFVIVTLLLLVRNRKNGLRAWVENVKQRFWRIVGADIVIILGLVVLILIYNVMREPYLAWEDEHNERVQAKKELDGNASELNVCTSNLNTEQVKSQLLGNQVTAQQTQISGQQMLIAGQQATSATQQSTFNLCVTTLAKANAPIQLSTTLLKIEEAKPHPDTKHAVRFALLTNKPVTPVKMLFWCDGTIKTASVATLSGAPDSASITALSSGSLFVAPKIWQINMSFPVWSPEQPLLVQLNYDADDLGSCVIRG